MPDLQIDLPVLTDSVRDLIANVSVVPMYASDCRSSDAVSFELPASLSPPAKAAASAALHLLVGDLERSHSISQDLKTPLGSFWHGVMHRTEGDYGNAKYWFRLASPDGLYEQVGGLCPDGSIDIDANELVDAVQRHAKTGGTDELRRIVWAEWQVGFRASLSTS